MNDRDADARLKAAFMLGVDLAPDTLQNYGVRFQRLKCLSELDEMATAITEAESELASTVEHERAIIDEGADVIITAICACASIGAMNWKEQLADRIAFKVARTRTRMTTP